MIARRLYDVGYRWFRMPWEIGPRQELVDLVERGSLTGGRAIDLGCGTGANAVFLAEHGYAVTGVDFAPSALARAQRLAARAGVHVDFAEDDLTALRRVTGPFDLLVDYGVLDDLSPSDRDRYVRNVVPLARGGSQFLLWCFEWRPRRWEGLVGFRPMAPGEVERRFGSFFTIQRIAGTPEPDLSKPIPGFAAYLMTRLA